MYKQHLPLYIALLSASAIIGVFVYMGYRFDRAADSGKSVLAVRAPENLKTNAVTNIHVVRVTPFSIATVDRPQFSGELSVLNAPIMKLLDDGMTLQASSSEENWKARVETADSKGSVPETPAPAERFPFYASWSLPRFDDGGVSVLVRYGEFSGGAHGSESVATFNYDFKTHKIITLADLFPGESGYLDKVSKMAIHALKSERMVALGVSSLSDSDVAWIKEGAGPKAENFQDFTVEGNRLTIYFAQYQVGPYAIGMPKVEFPLPI